MNGRLSLVAGFALLAFIVTQGAASAGEKWFAGRWETIFNARAPAVGIVQHGAVLLLFSESGSAVLETAPGASELWAWGRGKWTMGASRPQENVFVYATVANDALHLMVLPRGAKMPVWTRIFYKYSLPAQHNWR